MVSDLVDYSVGVNEQSVVLCVHNETTTITLSMSEPCVVKLIQLLGSTLEQYKVDILKKTKEAI